MALTDNIIAYYKLEDLTDATGNGNTLTAVNSPSVVTGKIWNCYDFVKSSNQCLYTTSLFSWNWAYTYSFWVAPVKITTNDTIENFTKPLWDHSTIWWSLIFTYWKAWWSSQQEALTISVYSWEAYTTVNRTTDQWYHICYVHTDATTNTLYINGVLQTINNSSTLNNRTVTTWDFTISNSVRAWTYQPTDAKIDEVWLRSRALSSTEVALLYDTNRWNQYPFHPLTLTFWEFLGSGAATTKGLYHLNWNSIDSSWNGNNWVDTNVSYSLANGKFWQGAWFNGSSSTMKITANNIIWASYTINAIIKPTTTAWVTSVVTSITDKSWSLWFIDLNFQVLLISGKLEFRWTKASPNTDYTVTSVANISTTEWTFATLVYNDSDKTGKIYLNWKLDNSASRPNWVNALNLPVFVWVYNLFLWYYYSWLIDEVIIENVARSPEKVKRYYSFAKGRFAA
jgi:hypothetical protein